LAARVREGVSRGWHAEPNVAATRKAWGIGGGRAWTLIEQLDEVELVAVDHRIMIVEGWSLRAMLEHLRQAADLVDEARRYELGGRRQQHRVVPQLRRQARERLGVREGVVPDMKDELHRAADLGRGRGVTHLQVELFRGGCGGS
jgi:hypothetical protein